MNFTVQLFQIIAFKRKPQDIRHDINAAICVFIAYIASFYYYLLITNLSNQPLLFSVIHAIIQGAIYFLVLLFNKKQARFVQMISALFGTLCILQLLGLAVSMTPLAMLGIYLSLWTLVLTVYILRESLECKTPEAILLNIACYFLTGLALIVLFPDFYQHMITKMQAPQ